MGRQNRMTSDTKYLGYTEVEGDGYMEASKYRVKCRCLRCGHVYSRVVKRLTDPDPPCPKKVCKESVIQERISREAANMQRIIDTGETPARVGENNRVKAFDMTAEIVMQDYKMGDMKDTRYAGDNSAPSLTQRQQKMSENFWGGKKMSDRRTFQNNMQQTVRNAMQGAYLPGRGPLAGEGAVSGNEVLTTLHQKRIKPQTNIILDANKPPKS
jgi:predicted  nucleic acid-binding Zn-ribbon protein